MASKVSVIGGGSWATALVKVLSDRNKVNWWVRKEETRDFIKQHRHNPNYLTDVEIRLEHVDVGCDLEAALSAGDMVVLAVPSAFLHPTMAGIKPGTLRSRTVFSAIKGIVPESLSVVGDYMHRQFDIPVDRIGVITGPCHAEEVALEKLSYLTIACQDTVRAEQLGSMLTCRYLNTAISDDIYGTEYAAVLKNVIAIASGICRGLGYGDNFQAVLIASAIREIKRFVDAVHPISRDINDAAYLGDLLVTAYSQFSRNRMFGNMIGKGYSVHSAQMEMKMVAEGYYAVRCIHELNKKHNASLPICNAVYRILYENASPRQEMATLSASLG